MIQTQNESRNPEVDFEESRSRRGEAEGLSGAWTQVWANLLEAAEAQLAIGSLQITRAVVRLAGVVLGLFALAVLAGYGLFLLDGCLAIALQRPEWPLWFSPLVRGLGYFFIATSGLAYLWHTVVGFDSKPVRTET